HRLSQTQKNYKKEKKMIIVNLVIVDYELKIILEGDFQKEQKRLGDDFEEVMFKRAIAQADKDGWTLPPLPTYYEVIEG
ncbi:hypothetical protein, partial [Bacillus amyloliquefaciens]